jgi:hypothetical protein
MMPSRMPGCLDQALVSHLTRGTSGGDPGDAVSALA